MTTKKTLTTREFIEGKMIDLAISIIQLTEGMPNGYAANHLSKQLLRSGTAPALIYAEACAAESHKDFLHKLKLALKELRETLVCLRIIAKSGIYSSLSPVKAAYIIANELAAIVITSIKTSKSRASQFIPEKPISNR